MNIFRLLFLSFFWLALCQSLKAQVTFTTKASANKIGKNDVVEINYEVINGTIENLGNPNFSSWQVVGGPNVSSSTIITNGQRTTSMSYQFVLKPVSAGVFKIPGATAVINGKEVTSKSVIVTVTTNSTEASAGTRQSNLPDPFFDPLPPEQPSNQALYDANDGYLIKDGEDILAKTKKNLFVLVNVSKKTCYPGEALRAEYQLYSRVNLDAHITKRPSFSGFSSIDLPDFTHDEYTTTTRNGKEFKVYPIRTVQLYPLLSGVQTLQPVEIETTVQYQKMPSGQSLVPYNPYEATNTINYPFTVKSDPVPVTVLPFPEAGKPADFNGVTGKFDIHVKADQRKLSLSEAGTVRLEITGSGNWAMVQQPIIKWPAGVDVFEPVITESLDSQAVPLTGRRIYEFPFSKSKPGKMVIPAISISYFDPEKKQYATSSSQPISIEILNQAKPANKFPQNNYGGLSGVDNTQIFTEIIKIAFPIIAVLLLLFVIIKNRRRNTRSRQHALYKKEYNERSIKQQETSLRPTTFTASNVYQCPVSTYNAAASSNTKNLNDEMLVEKSSLLNEHAGIPITTAKSYFTIVKKELLQMLQLQFKIISQGVPVTRNSLLQHGFTAEETNKIIDLLELCERHIYSPFNNDFDQPKCNEMVTEITSLVKSKPGNN